MENDLADYQKALYKRVSARGAPLCFKRSERDVQENTKWDCCCCPNWCEVKPNPRPNPRPYNARNFARHGHLHRHGHGHPRGKYSYSHM